MTVFGLSRKEIATLSSETGKALGVMTAMEVSGAAAIVGSVALDAAVVLVPCVVAGEWLGRGVAEALLPKEYRGRLSVTEEAGAALAKDVKSVAGLVVKGSLDKAIPGAGALTGPAVELASNKAGVGSIYDQKIGIESNQASYATVIGERVEDIKTVFKNKLASFRGAKADEEVPPAPSARPMKA